MNTNERTNTLTGTWKEGQIILDEPADWPDGCRVTVVPIAGQVETLGITEEQWPRTPEAVAEWLAWFDSIEPIEMTPEEEADCARRGKRRRAAREYGRIFAALRRNGRMIQQVDIQVAAIALSLGNCTVVSGDTDFFAVPGLSVESWV